MISKRQKNSNKKRIKKWPFFVFIPVGLVNFLMIFCLLMEFAIDPYVTKRELKKIEADFNKWTDSGFCLYEEMGGYYLHFPNGSCDKYRDRFSRLSDGYTLDLVGSSKKELLLIKRYYESSGRNETEIIKTNLDASDNHFSIFRLHSNEYNFMITDDWKIVLWDTQEKETSIIEIDFESGTYIDSSMLNKDWKSYQKSIIVNGSLDYCENGFFAKLPNGNTVFLNSDNLDSELLTLFKKWHFEPSYSRRLPNNTVACVFCREQFLNIGQDARFLVQVDYDGSVIANQYLTIKSKWYEGERLFPICEELPNKIVRFYEI